MMVNGNRGLGGWAGPFPGYACLLSLLVRREWEGEQQMPGQEETHHLNCSQLTFLHS